MLMWTAAFLGGLVLLVFAADRFVRGAAALARNLGVSPLMIGLTVVGIGTSAPEMIISGTAALDGRPELAVGNALGSNIANIALIIGFTALVKPIVVRSDTLIREFPLMLGATFVAAVVLFDQYLSRWDGLVLATALLLVLWMLARLARADKDVMAAEFEEEYKGDTSTAMAALQLLLGLVALLIAAKLMVWGAVNIATAFGVSELIIGLTIVAIGTSLPELAASLASMAHGEDDIAVGNIIGSNIFNLLAVLPIAALIAPVTIAEEVIYRDLALVAGLSVALGVLAWGRGGKNGQIGRISGLALLLILVSYQYWLFNSAMRSVS